MELIPIENIIFKNNTLHSNRFFCKKVLKKSIEKYGQLRPIIVNENYEIIDGNLMYEILKEKEILQVWIKKINTTNDEQTYCELNINKKIIDVPKFLTYVKNNIDTNNNCLPFTKDELKGFIHLCDFDWKKEVDKELKSTTLF